MAQPGQFTRLFNLLNQQKMTPSGEGLPRVSDDKNQTSTISFGPFRLVPQARLLEKDGAPVRVGGRALDLLIFLAERRGEVVSKRDLVKGVWANLHVDEGSLRFHLTALRKALGETGMDARYIVNVAGRGYCFAAPLPEPQPVAPTTQVSPARSLPSPHPSLIGRAEAIEKISAELLLHRFVTIVGPGGIGKTSVAVAVGHAQRTEFGEQLLFVDFSALRDVGLVAGSINAALGLTVTSQDPVSSLLAALRGRHMLLILDSCEHLVDALASLVERIVRDLPEVHVLATSRESLRAEGERVYRLLPLECPPESDGHGPIDVLAYPAVQLFMDRVSAATGGFRLEDEEVPIVADICRRLDGIALAIELAAGRVNAYGIAGTASLLNNRFSLLWPGRRTAIPRHRTLGAAIGWSYDLLPAVESAILRRLAIFAGPFTLEAVLAVSEDENADHSEAIESIGNLVAKSLISRPSHDSSPRYRLLDTTRAYCLDKLNEAKETDIVARRHAQYFRHLFEQAESEWETRPIPEWLAVYGFHMGNLRTALDWAFSPSGDAALGVSLTIAAVPLWTRLSLFRECRDRAEKALAHLDKDVPDYARVRMQLSAAIGWSLMYGEGRARDAGAALATTLELAEQLGDKDYRLRALWGLCIDQFNNGHFGKALEFAQRFMDAAETSADQTDRLLADRLMAVSLHYLGDQNGARRHIDRVHASLDVLEGKPRTFPLDLRSSTQYFRARILWLQGLADQATALVSQNIQEGAANGHPLTFCSVLGQSACPIALLAGDFETAKRHATALLEHTERYEIRLWRLWAGAFRAAVLAKAGDTETALPLLRSELDRAGDARLLPRFLLLHGELAICLGNANEVRQGLEVVEDALARCNRRQEQWYVPELLRIKGELILKDGKRSPMSSAEGCFGEALELAEQQGALFWKLRTTIGLARLRIGQDRQAEARRLLGSALGSFVDGVQTADMREARTLLDSLPPPSK
jgi:predicted ATPase/DNA-binding winged helix-turn-helix (wHTH) protein